MDGAWYPNPCSGDKGHSVWGSGLPQVVLAVVPGALGSAGDYQVDNYRHG